MRLCKEEIWDLEDNKYESFIKIGGFLTKGDYADQIKGHVGSALAKIEENWLKVINSWDKGTRREYFGENGGKLTKGDNKVGLKGQIYPFEV